MLVYTSDDPVLALELESAARSSGHASRFPIGSGQGVINKNSLSIIIERASVPIIVDAGVGTASDVSIAMELGAEGVLLNTGIAHAKQPVMMARAMRQALESGYWAARAGRIGMKRYANASSPMEGLITSPSGIVDDGIPGE